MNHTINYSKVFTNLWLFLFLIYATSTVSQSVTFVTQDDVDSFDQSITEIVGDLTIGSHVSHSNITNLENLSNIQSANRNLYIWHNDSLKTLEGLNALSHVGFNVIIRDNNSLEDLSAFGNLKQINRKLTVEENDLLKNLDGLSSIKKICTGIEIKNNEELTNIDGFTTSDSLNGDVVIRFNNKLTSINGLSNLKWIGGALDVVFNEELTDISALLGLRSVGKSVQLRGGTDFTSYFGLDSLKTIGENLNISYMPNLTNLSGLNSLEYIGQDLSIFQMASLTDIDALSSLNTVGRRLSIHDIPKLNNLDGLAKLTYVGDGISIFNNESLSNCCGVQYILSDPNPSDIVISFGSNQSECNSKDAILNASCNISRIGGGVFYDTNENGIKDDNEFGIPGVRIHINQDGMSRLTNNFGKFQSLSLEGQQYKVAVEIEEGWKLTSDSLEYNFEYEQDVELYENLNFGIVKEQPLSLSKINFTSEETRCNSDVNFHIRLVNNGHQEESGYFIFRIDTGTSYVSSTPMMTLDGSDLRYDFNNIGPFQSSDYEITLAMPTEQSTGDVIKFYAEVYYYDIDGEGILKDSFTYESIVLCSYDPNDKKVSPVGIKEENFTLIEDELNYTIRFQNTGNASAINVRIKDTLDQNLDIQTFEVANSSFPVRTTISDRAIEYFFENIQLPDSLSNEEESHGFVSYSIRVNADIEELTTITNTAHIIFDSNPAIITNTTMNTMVESICDDQFITINDTICEGQDYLGYTESGNYQIEYPLGITCDSFVDLNLEVLDLDHPKCTVNLNETKTNTLSIYPNPTSGIFEIYGGTVQNWQLFNMQGVLLLQKTSSNQVDLSEESNGIYLISVYSEGEVEVIRVVRI